VIWVYHRMLRKATKESNAPNRGAWGLLQWARKNRNGFYDKLLPKILAAWEQRNQQDDEVRAETMTVAERARSGVRLEAVGDRLRLYPRSAVTPELMEQLRAHKSTLLAALRTDAIDHTDNRVGQQGDRHARDLADDLASPIEQPSDDLFNDWIEVHQDE